MTARARLIYGLAGVSLFGLALSWWNWDRFPDTLPLDPAIDEPPRQVEVVRPTFVARAHDHDYEIRPLYEYELTGLVVSFKRFRPGIGLHERWNDYINVADICVVWGGNARDVDLNAFDFWNGEFTCNFSTRDRTAWERFDETELSNNHLVTDDPAIRDAIDALEVGDQIHLRGWLAEYGQPGGPMRGTSTSRTDTGDGACETIYLSEFRILDSMETGWRRLWPVALFGLALAAFLWWITPHRAMRGY